jgi:hypothetical protein
VCLLTLGDDLSSSPAWSVNRGDLIVSTAFGEKTLLLVLRDTGERDAIINFDGGKDSFMKLEVLSKLGSPTKIWYRIPARILRRRMP